MIQSISPSCQNISSVKAPDIQKKENSNLVRSLASVYSSHETMSFPSPQKINESPSSSVPDRGHIAATGGSIYDESLLEPKMTRYREYRCRGHNPSNAHLMLKVLKSRLAAENKSDYGHAVRDISALLPALEQLAGELLTLDALESLTDQQRDAVNKREEVVRGLLRDSTLLLNFLPHRQAHFREKTREALRDELVNSALERLLNEQKNTENHQLYEAEIRALIHASPYLMSIQLRKGLESFYAAGLAKLNEPVKQELDRINRTLKSARRFLSQDPGNAMPLGPHPFPVATSDFQHNVKKCAELLGAVLTCVNRNIQEISTAQKDTTKHRKGKNTLRGVTNYLDPIELFDKSARSLPRSELISFDKAPANTRELCLRLKEMSQPVQGLAAQLQRAARALENAITDAKSHGTKALSGVDTPDKAVIVELQILTDDTPQTRLLQAMQAAWNVALQVKNTPTFPPLPSSAVSADTEKVFRHFIHESFDTLRSAASQLNQTLQLAKNDLKQESVTYGLNCVIRMAEKMQNDFRYQLESNTGVSLDSSRELLNEQQNILLRMLHPVTRITGKGHSQYPALTHTAEQARINKARFSEIHRSILPMLNQVEKVRVANRMLEMGLSASGKENDSEYKVLNTAIQKCRGLQLNDIRKVGASAVQVSGTKDIAVYRRGDIGAVHSTTLGKVLKRLSGELLETAQRVQIAAGGAAWSVDENKKTLSLEVTKMTKRLETIKADIKDVVWAATGARLHNNPPEGMIAKDAGEWLAVLRKEWDGKYTRQEINKETEKVIRYISKEFASEDDPEGQLFKTRIMLALRDAEGDGIPWPLTAEEHLGGTKANKAYIQAWAEKRLTYGMLYNLLIHGATTAMFSVHKSSLVSPLRLLNLLMTPVRMEMTRRAMEKVRPGNPQPSAMIAEYESREIFQAAVRLVSMLSPQLPKTVAAIGITASGLREGGEYRDEFLKRAVSRLPGDLFWVGGFAAWGASVQNCWKYNVDGTVVDDQITAEMLATLKKQLEDMQATAGNEYEDEDETVEFRSEYSIAELKALEVAYEAHETGQEPHQNAALSHLNLQPADEGGQATRKKREADYELVLYAPTFNDAMNAWFSDEGKTTTDPGLLEYIKIFSSTPSSANLAQLANAVDDDFSSQVRYIFALMKKLELKSWPIDFLAVKRGFERDSDNEQSGEKLNILNNLYHQDNPRLPVLLGADYAEVYKCHSELKRYQHLKQERKDHLASLKEGRNVVQNRYIRKEKLDTQNGLKIIEQNILIRESKISQLERKKYLREIMVLNKTESLREKTNEIALSSPSKEDIRLTLASMRDNGKIKLDYLIIKNLKKHSPNLEGINLEQRCTVRYVQGTSFTGGGITSSVSTTKEFTLRQILLGEPERSVFIKTGGSQLITNIECENEDIKSLLGDKYVRLSIAGDVMKDVENSLNKVYDNPIFSNNYKAVSIGKIINTINKNSARIYDESSDPAYRKLVDGFIEGAVKPQPLLFKEKVVPDVYSLTGGDYRILISIKTGELVLFNAITINPELPAFVKKHLSDMDSGAFVDADVQPIRHPDQRLNQKWEHKITDIEINNNISAPDALLLDPYGAVYKACIEKSLSNLNGVIYTSKERDLRLKNDVNKVLVQSASLLLMLATWGVSNTANTIIGVASGLGEGVANIYLDTQLAENADRYEDVKEAEKDIMLGKVFLALEVAIPIFLHVKGSFSGRQIIQEIAEEGKNKYAKIPSPFKYEEKYAKNITPTDDILRSVPEQGGAVFTLQQTDFLNKVKVKIKKESGFDYVPMENNNHKYSGNVYIQKKTGDADLDSSMKYIEMNGEFVPVKNTKHQGAEDLYEVYDPNSPLEKGYPIEWDRGRWMFERETSVNMSGDVAQFLKKDMKQQHIDAGELSAPDHMGLRRNTDGETFIKINDSFYKVEATSDGHILHLPGKEKLGLKLSYGKNEFKNEVLSARKSGENSLGATVPNHVDQRLNRRNAFKVKPNKKIDELLNNNIIRTDFKSGDLSAINSIGIRKDSSGKMYIKVEGGWVNLEKDLTGYYIPNGNEIIRVEYFRGQWRGATKAQGFPEQFNYYSGEKAKATVTCKDGFSITFEVNPQETLTKNLLNHFDAIDDGIVFDMSKANSTKHDLFSINKITINKSGSEVSVFYPNEKPGGFKYYEVLFDDVPVNYVELGRVLIQPDSYETFAKYAQYPHDLHIMKQGNMDSCGYTCVAMIAKDRQHTKNIDESFINHLLKMKDESLGGVFSPALSARMTESGIANRLIYSENPINYIQNSIREGRWSGIVNIDGHFCIITNAGNGEFYLRDPYQGILSVVKLEKLKEYKIGNDIIEIEI